ncbi:MAG: PTS sugar transporter subunit IIA [Acidiferrobacterales bacterium]|nr:PTS sugar transporter subunit IIA [Acidiferrobacterales bacterium]
MTHPALLHEYLNADLISVQSEITSRKKLLEQMAQMLSVPLTNAKPKDIYHCLLEREKLGNTGIGNGVALPHSRSDQATTAIVAVITLKDAIDYHSVDRQDVDVAFGILVPSEATSQHLGLLASIAKLMSDNSKKAELLSVKSNEQALELITSWSRKEFA